MRDRGTILGGLFVFLALITFPLWYGPVRGTSTRPPDLELPTTEKECVADTAYMRTNHMHLLMDWREKAVRENQRIFTTWDHRRYYRSLSGTCLGCHRDKEKFCDRCHDYVGTKPYCWDCHVAPRGGQG